MASTTTGCFLVVLVFGQALATPVMYHEPSGRPLAVVPALGQRLAPHSFQQPGEPLDARLPIPTPQDLEAIKKVAQILVMLGEQIIPAIIGDSPLPAPHAGETVLVGDVPNDPVL